MEREGILHEWVIVCLGARLARFTVKLAKGRLCTSLTMVICVCCDVHRLFSLKTGARSHTLSLFKSTHAIVRSTDGSAENSSYLPGPDVIPSKPTFKACSFLVSTFRKTSEFYGTYLGDQFHGCLF